MPRKKKPVKTMDFTTPARPTFRAISKEQAAAYEACEKNDITFITGPAGCSKTFTAVAFAIDCILSNGSKRLLLTRPAVEACGEDLGALPGGVADKMAPFLFPLTDTIKEYAKDHKIAAEIVAMA